MVVKSSFGGGGGAGAYITATGVTGKILDLLQLLLVLVVWWC